MNTQNFNPIHSYVALLGMVLKKSGKDVVNPLPNALAGAEPHSGLGGPWPLQNFFFFPLAYEEKLIRPPQHFIAGPPTNFSQILPPLNQKLVTPSN